VLPLLPAPVELVLPARSTQLQALPALPSRPGTALYVMQLHDVVDEQLYVDMLNAYQADPTATYVAGINGATVADGIAVVVGANGHLGTITSSASYKDKIKPMEKASEAILSLRPVSFRYKEELDPKGIPQFGLVAEDVAKVAPDLVARDEHGKPYTVRYEAVNAMLLNEFLKAHRKVEEQGTEIAELKSTVAELKSALKEQAAQIRQVSAQIAVGERSTRLVSSNE